MSSESNDEYDYDDNEIRSPKSEQHIFSDRDEAELDEDEDDYDNDSLVSLYYSLIFFQ